jgi:hypothetical protein
MSTWGQGTFDRWVEVVLPVLDDQHRFLGWALDDFYVAEFAAERTRFHPSLRPLDPPPTPGSYDRTLLPWGSLGGETFCFWVIEDRDVTAIATCVGAYADAYTEYDMSTTDFIVAVLDEPDAFAVPLAGRRGAGDECVGPHVFEWPVHDPTR